MSEHKTNNTIQAFWVGIGSFSAFAVSMLSSVILSRYFDKADYGTYRQVLYVYQTLLVVFTLGLPKAYSYFLPRVADCCAKSLIRKITRIFYVLGGVFSVSLYLFSPLIASVLKNPDLESALRIFSPVPFLLLPTMGIEGVLAVFQKTKYIALYNVITKGLILLCAVLPVVCWNGSYNDAIWGFVVASFLSFLVVSYLRYWCVKAKGNQSTSISYREIFKFALPLMFASLWAILGQSADKFYISRYFGTAVFAEFSNGSLQLPFVGMIIGACSTVLTPLFSKKVYEQGNAAQEILPIWKSVFKKTIKITYPLVIFCLFFADYIMVLLYGESYSNSGIYFSIMLIVNFFTVISYFPILIAIGASAFYNKVQMFGALSMIVLELLSILLFHSPYVVTAVSVLCRVTIIYVMLKFIARYFGVTVLEIIPTKLCTVIVIPSIVVLYAVRLLVFSTEWVDVHLLLKILLSLILYLILYAFWCKIVGVEYISIMKPLLKKL